MKSMIMIYKTDNQHSYASRDLIAAAMDKEAAIKLCRRQARKEGSKLNEDDLFNLQNISQTQGYNGNGEFDMETISINTLL